MPCTGCTPLHCPSMCYKRLCWCVHTSSQLLTIHLVLFEPPNLEGMQDVGQEGGCHAIGSGVGRPLAHKQLHILNPLHVQSLLQQTRYTLHAPPALWTRRINMLMTFCAIQARPCSDACETVSLWTTCSRRPVRLLVREAHAVIHSGGTQAWSVIPHSQHLATIGTLQDLLFLLLFLAATEALQARPVRVCRCC